MLEWIPVEMRPMSIISAVLFFFGAIAIVYLHARTGSIDRVVVHRSNDIAKLIAVCASTEKAVESIKDDNRKMIGWVREDNKSNLSRIEKSIAEIRTQLYGGE